VLALLEAMCRTVGEVHARGVVHRKLTRATMTIVVGPDGGEIVCFADVEPPPERGEIGEHHGWTRKPTSFAYHSPEQIMGKPLDARSDIYALGAIAYELVTGVVPFPDANGPAGVLTAQLKTIPRPPSARMPDAAIPAEVDALILRCLAKHRDDRFADCATLARVAADLVAN
jgi:serine/threonine protein kinase